jgi:hypothetical protein
MKSLFLAWQDPESRRWFPVGRLWSSDGLYSFAYTMGAKQAKEEAQFEPLVSFPDLYMVYVSERLFPLFSNRVLPASRPEYPEYLQWLNVPVTKYDPVAILARSGGRRVTDTLEVFPSPERNENGAYVIHFLVHGLGHMSECSITRAKQLEPHEPLLAMQDFQNPKDPEAIALRTAERIPGDLHMIGYCPSYLRHDILALLRGGCLKITVERVNPPPAPLQFRVLCKAVIEPPEGFELFAGPEYQPIVGDAFSSRISLPPRHNGPGR